MIELICMGCGKSFSRNLSLHNANIRRGRTIVACSNACVQIARYGKPVQHKCQNCATTFVRNKSKNDTYKYCSQSCAATANNKSRKIVSNPKQCKSCQNIVFGRRTTCDPCKKQKNYSRRIDWNSVTLLDLKSRYSLSQYHAKLRGMARSEYKKHNKSMTCEHCGYSLHIDVCHIKGIADFPLDSIIADVNHIDNLIGLDKRCHWEFDNGYLSLEQVRSHPA